MFNIYKSNKIEVLVELLAKEILLNPPNITEELDICINDYFLGKWIRDQITLKNNISALYQIKTITKYTEELINRLNANGNSDEWHYENIKWGIINSFEELSSHKESIPLKKWITKYLNTKIIDSDIFNLINRIAKVFSDYLIYRPEIIRSWHNNEINSSKLFYGLNKEQYWQAILYKLLQKKFPNKPACLLMIDIIEDINSFKKVIEEDLPKKSFLFINNNLSKIQINFYSAISKYRDIDLYMLSPGYSLWKRINTEEGIISFDQKSKSHNTNSINLEKIFCSYAANFDKLLEENILSSRIIPNNNLIFIDPTASKSDSKNISLLKQLQKKIIINDDENLRLTENEDSILFIPHSSILSQLEFVREQIIKVLESNSDINYSDICIVSPDINNLKPYLNFIFNNKKLTGAEIPYYVAKIDYKEISGVYNFLNEIIEISKSKLNIRGLDSLLTNPITQLIFNYSLNEKNEFISILKSCGFHWGIDKVDRLGEYKNSLDWCIERIVLGMIYDEDCYFQDKEIKPFDTRNNFIDLHKWIEIISEIKLYLDSLKGCFKYSQWIQKIKNLLNRCKDINELIDEVNNVYEILDHNNLKVESDSQIELSVIVDLLSSYFNNINSNPNYRNNEILIGDISRVSLLPHKIIYVIDMNENKFPKKEINENINIIKNKFVFGDPKKLDKEKNLFLELLMSSRKQLIISWVAFDEDNRKKEISQPILQMIHLLKELLNKEEYNMIIRKIYKNENCLFKVKNKEKDYQNYGLVNKLEWDDKLYINKNYKLSDLTYWISNPQIFWLNNRNIKLKREFIHNPDDESISNYEKFKLLDNIFKKVNIENKDLNNFINKINIREEIISNGIIAPKNSIHIKEDEIRKLINSLFINIKDLKNINRTFLKLNTNKIEYYYADENIIYLIHSNLSLSKRLEAWVKFLFIVSNEKNIKKTKLIYRSENKYRVESLIAPSHKKAKELLNDYINIFTTSKTFCLPAPPESSYKYIKAKFSNKDPERAFRETWVGDKNFRIGERDKPEMRICFGYEVNPDLFLQNNYFKDLSLRIYKPLIDCSDA